ncbi:DUF924 family protein [Ferrimonas gelatinilytica]|uniref:DUF924 family protein n=1 Tax=Ferrimonas gelatinilytica TaxID=1255257 RepID=A0ABP9S1D9_9GAMM
MNKDDVLDYWFGELDADGLPTSSREKLWFGASPAMDAEIRERFAALHQQAADGELEHWTETPLGRLALILLLDQFSRNLFRGQAQAFAYDEKALALCKEGIKKEEDRQLAVAHRLFFYMPLQHSEQLEVQRLGERLLAQWQASLSGAARDRVAEGLRFQQAHLEIIDSFGRFPHRNAALGRESSEDEARYLAKNAPRFGQ